MSEPQRTDLESALREAARAVREGRPADPVVISAAALWQLSEIIQKQDQRIDELRRKR